MRCSLGQILPGKNASRISTRAWPPMNTPRPVVGIVDFSWMIENCCDRVCCEVSLSGASCGAFW